MSLHVYLRLDEKVWQSSSGIFIRENGATKEISEQEWNEMHPAKRPVRLEFRYLEETDEAWSANITHNLGRMAKEAGLYLACWRPEEIGVMKAGELIEHLKRGLDSLKSDSERFKKFNPENGWGTYEGFVEFVESYLNACCKYPMAEIGISR